MTYTVSSGTLNSTIPYHTIDTLIYFRIIYPNKSYPINISVALQQYYLVF